MKTNVYIDAFNLYYGCLKNSPYRWLNLGELCRLMLPKNQINQIKYFTALVKPRPNDLDQPIRQQFYLRALQTLPNVSVIYGHFLSSVVSMPLANPVAGQPTTVRVRKSEEKGSDVNLAVHLLNDGHLKDYDIAVVISNDSDLVEPIKIVRNQLNLQVGVLNPQLGTFDRNLGRYDTKYSHPSQELRKYASFFKPIRQGVLSVSQFSPTLTDTKGTFSKPVSW